MATCTPSSYLICIPEMARAIVPGPIFPSSSVQIVWLISERPSYDVVAQRHRLLTPRRRAAIVPVGRGPFARVVQTGKDVPEQTARLARIVAKMARDDPGVADREHAEQQRGGDEGGRSRAAQRASRQGGQCRHTAPTPAGR